MLLARSHGPLNATRCRKQVQQHCDLFDQLLCVSEQARLGCRATFIITGSVSDETGKKQYPSG